MSPDDVAPPPPVPAFGEPTAARAGLAAATVPVDAPSPGLDETPAEDFDTATLEQIEAELREVEPALRAIEDGSYGTCDKCGLALADEVLAEHPTAICSDRVQLPGCLRLRLPIHETTSA